MSEPKDLATRMREAADTLEDVSDVYGYRFPVEAGWSAKELRYEAAHIEGASL